MTLMSPGEAIASKPLENSLTQQQLLRAIAGYTHLSPLKQALQECQPCVHWLTSRQTHSIQTIVVEEGEASSSLDGDPVDKSFQAYLDHVIQPLIQAGQISDGSKVGSFDDRKLRWSNTNVDHMVDRTSQTLRLAVGPTWYQQCQRDIHRDPEDSRQLMLSGLKDHGDPYAYFARGLGVVVIPLTSRGHAFIGKRRSTHEYNNFLCFVSGWASFCSSINAVDIYRDLERELQEEIHFAPPLSRERTTCVGLAGHPLTGEADLVFVTQTDLEDEYFQQGDWPEHETWYAIRNRQEAQQLLDHGTVANTDEKFDIMFSSRMGLDFLINNQWTS